MIGWCSRRCDAGVKPVLGLYFCSATPLAMNDTQLQAPSTTYKKKTATPKDGGRNIESNLKIS